MDAYHGILTKRDLRTFTDRPIDRSALIQILEAGRRTGSSRNRQPWHFVVVADPPRLRDLAGYGRFAQHVARSAAAVAVLLDDAGAAFDAGRCAQNMMLAAWALGIASCPASMHRADEAKALLGIPPDKTIAIVIGFGYPHPSGRGVIERTALRILTGRGRRPLDSVVSWERYGLPPPPLPRV
ncbi:MAG TPA: nitroreductase family protein [bacterium]